MTRIHPIANTRKATDAQLMRGQYYTRHLHAEPIPQTIAMIAAKLDAFLNLNEGDCDSAEECQAINTAWDVLIQPTVLQEWLNKHGYARGAYSTDVLKTMASEGITNDGTNYKDGPYTLIDPKNLQQIQTALATCTDGGNPRTAIKLDIAAAQIDAQVDLTKPFSFITNCSPDGNVNHCTNAAGYGTAADLLMILNTNYNASLTLPLALLPQTPSLLHYTWGQYQIADATSIANIAHVGYLRTPGSIRTTVTPPAPSPDPRPCRITRSEIRSLILTAAHDIAASIREAEGQ